MSGRVQVHHAQAGSLVLVVSGHTAGHLAAAWRAYLTGQRVPPPADFRELLGELEGAAQAWLVSATVRPAATVAATSTVADHLDSVVADERCVGELTTQQTAQRLGVGRTSVDKLRRRGHLPARTKGRGYVFPEAAVEALAARRDLVGGST